MPCEYFNKPQKQALYKMTELETYVSILKTQIDYFAEQASHYPEEAIKQIQIEDVLDRVTRLMCDLSKRLLNESGAFDKNSPTTSEFRKWSANHKVQDAKRKTVN